MTIKELLKQINDNITQVAKSLVDGKNDEAVDLLTKSAEVLGEAIAKSDEPADAPAETPADAPSDTPAETPAETPETELEKSTPLTKSQQATLAKFADVLGDLSEDQVKNLTKWVEMYISASDVPDFVAQFEQIKDRLTGIEKTSDQHPEKSETPTSKTAEIAKSMSNVMAR